MARWRMFGSFLGDEEAEVNVEAEGNGATGFAGKGRVRVWLRATVA